MQGFILGSIPLEFNVCSSAWLFVDVGDIVITNYTNERVQLV